MASREELANALSYLRRKDPNNPSLQKFDRVFRSYASPEDTTTYASVKLFDNWNKNVNSANQEKQYLNGSGKKMVIGSDGSWQTAGYEKEMKKRAEMPFDYVNQDAVTKIKDLQDKLKQQQQAKQKSLNSTQNTGYTYENPKNFLGDLRNIGKMAIETINPFDNVDAGQALQKYANAGLSKGYKEVQRGANRAVDSASFSLMSNLDKKMTGQTPDYLSQRKVGQGGVTDFITSGLGYLVPGTAEYKALNGMKVGQSLTKFGTTELAKDATKKEITKALSKRLASEAAKGVIIGAGTSIPEVAFKEALNPNDQNWKDNAKYIGMNTALGAVADPLFYGVGKGFSKGLETASNKTMKNLLPRQEQVQQALINHAKSINADYALPVGNGKNPAVLNESILNGLPNLAPNLKPKEMPNVTLPKVGKQVNSRDLNNFAKELMNNGKSNASKEVAASVQQLKDVADSVGKTNINPAPKNAPGTLPPSELDNHGYGLVDLNAEAKAQQKKVAPALLDTARQSQGNAESFRSKINDTPKKEKGLFSNLHAQFIDDVSPLAKIEKQITGKVNSAENSLYKQARLFKGSAEKAHLIVQEQLHPIFNDMEKSGINYKDLRDYALAVHAKDVNEKGINSGLTNAEIADVINRFGSPKMEELRKKLVGVNDYAMKLLSSGDKPVLNPSDVASLKEKWPNYMSLFRSFDDNKVDFAGGIGKSMANVTNPLKKLEGSDKQIVDPMESIIKNLFKAVNVSDRNKVAAQIGKLAEQDTAGNFIKKLANNEDVSRLNVISVMDNGKKVKYEVPPEVYKTMMNLDKESSNTLIKILQKPAAVLRAGATLTPEFSLRNPLRDVPNAFVTSNSGFNPIIDFPIGLWQSIWKGRTIKIGNKEFKTSGELYKQFIKENGGYGNIISMDRKLHQKLLKQALTEHNQSYVDVLDPKTYAGLLKSLANPVNTLRNIADVSESATKVGEFRAALRSGATPQEAAYRARDLMDFARAGVSVREANKVVAFLNANIQGKSKLFRAFKENPVKFTGKATAAVTIPTIGAIVAQNTYANDKQRTIINDAPQWLKDTFYLIPIPGTDQIARIPKPFDLAFAFSNSLERAFNFVAKHDPQAFDGFIKSGFSQASIPVMLTGIAPIVEGMANYSFFKQGSIIPRREENINYPDQYDVNTSEAAKFIGKGIDKMTGGQGPFKNFGSPRVIDNTIQGFTGGTGTYAANAIDWFLNKTGAVNNPDRPAKNLDQKPLARAFLVNQSSSGESLDKLYTIKDQLTKEKGSAKQNNQPFTHLGEYNMVNKATQNLSDINKNIRMIENSTKFSAEQKRSMIDQLIQKRNEYARKITESLKPMR